MEGGRENWSKGQVSAKAGQVAADQGKQRQAETQEAFATGPRDPEKRFTDYGQEMGKSEYLPGKKTAGRRGLPE